MLKSKLNFSKLIVSLKANEDSRLPDFTGSLLRGSFGHALKKTFCVKNNHNCKNCDIIESCAYFQIFESQDSSYKKIGYHFKPHPYIITPSNQNVFKINDVLEFQITFFGNFIEHIDSFILAFQEMGKTGLGKDRKEFQLIEVSDYLSGLPVYKNGTRLNQDIENIPLQIYIRKQKLNQQNNIHHMDNLKLKLTFITPGRFAENGKVLRTINSRLLLESIIRRYTTMHIFYGIIDKDDVILESKFIIDPGSIEYKKWNRYSNRQERKVQQSGILGTYTVDNVSPKMACLLKSMEVLHIGKNTSFGLGKIKVDFS